jgi:hypothetical protein
MPVEEQPKPETENSQAAISEDASDWLQQVVKHFELNFVDACQGSPANADRSAYQRFTILAIVQTLKDSGLSEESIREMFGQIAGESIAEPIEWTAEMNRRRFSLIDKEIQGDLTPAEQFELARLTSAMRMAVDSELNLPMEGARALHRKLTDL